MSAPKPLPFFARLGINLFLTREDGQIVSLIYLPPPEAGGNVHGLIEEFLEQAAERGVFPPSQEQFAAYAQEVLGAQQREFIATQLQDPGATSGALRAFLATYEGRPGGDA